MMKNYDPFRALKDVMLSIAYGALLVFAVLVLVFVLAVKDAQAEEVDEVDKAAVKVWVMHHRECQSAIKSTAPSRYEALKYTAVYFKCMSLTYERAAKQMMDVYQSNPEVKL